jgi:glycosyltransferase involved in cell wall biosynthesis
LTSAYEGMPIAVLEALGCGLPVIATGVGEVSRVVRHGVNGLVVQQRTPEAIASAILDLLSGVSLFRGKPCTEAVRGYVPQEVLRPVYQNYRALAVGSQPRKAPLRA